MAVTPRWIRQATRAIRRLPPEWVRLLVLIDIALSFIPPWTYFFHCRWAGRLLGPREFFMRCWNGFWWSWQHLAAIWSGSGTGIPATDWRSPPIRRCRDMGERPDWLPKGSCGTCRKCCTTSWLPEAKQVSCPFLGEAGCTVYGGLAWDYFGCGRYPMSEGAVAFYGCPRFDAR